MEKNIREQADLSIHIRVTNDRRKKRTGHSHWPCPALATGNCGCLRMDGNPSMESGNNTKGESRRRLRQDQ